MSESSIDKGGCREKGGRRRLGHRYLPPIKKAEGQCKRNNRMSKKDEIWVGCGEIVERR